MTSFPPSNPPGEATSAEVNGLRVRPYLVTGGRTATTVELPLECQVLTTANGRSSIGSLDHERRRIAELCVSPHSLAEISAHLGMHLQVSRILVGDLIESETVTTRQAKATPTSNRPDLQLLERVLDGLQSL